MTNQLHHPAESAAERWGTLPPQERAAWFHQLPRGQQDNFFLALSVHDQAALLGALPEDERRLWMRLLAPDDAADVLQHVDDVERAGLLDLLDDSTRKEVNALLAFKEDEAGGRMDPRFARVRADPPCDEAISYVRRQAGHLRSIDYVYVLDPDQRLIGVVSLRELFLADTHRLVREIMRTDLIAVGEHMDQEHVARVLHKSHLLAVPVLDENRRMAGFVTLDD